MTLFSCGLCGGGICTLIFSGVAGLWGYMTLQWFWTKTQKSDVSDDVQD
jgi:hypothetical protein